MPIETNRIDYSTRELHESDAGPDPLALFNRWFEDAVAAGIPEPNVMTLATCTADCRPSARIVLLKICDERGLAFFTNYLSRKGHEIANNPHAALVFFLAPPGTADPGRGDDREDVRRRIGRVLRHPPAEQPAGGVGVRAERGAGQPRGTGGQSPHPGHPLPGRQRSPSPALGRVSGGPDRLGILAGPPQPPARPDSVPPGERRLDAGTSVALTGRHTLFPVRSVQEVSWERSGANRPTDLAYLVTMSAASKPRPQCCPPAEAMGSTSDDEALARLARAVAHPIRVRILRLLLEKQGCICGELVELLPVAQSTVSQHLKIMKEAGLVQGEVDGPKVCYCVDPAGLKRLKKLVSGLHSA